MSNEFVTRAETAAENAQLAANQATEAMNATAADRQAVEELVSTIDTTQLPSIQASKEAIRNAIVEQGQECDETVAFADYADKILAIETGVDVSDADSVTGADIRAPKKVYGSDGTLVTGTLAEVTAERVAGTNQVQVPAGIHEDQTINVGTVYSGDTTITPGESAVTIAADTLLLDGLTVAAVIDSGSSEVTYGYLNADGLMQPIDISGDVPSDDGSPIVVDLKVFDTGKPLPDYGGDIDLSGVTADSNAVLEFFTFVDAEGVLRNGSIRNWDNRTGKGIEINGNRVTVLSGHRSEDTSVTVEGTDTDLSFVTATASDILAGKVGVDKYGNPVNGTIQTVTAVLVDNIVIVPAGYHEATSLTVEEAAAPTVSGNIVTVNQGYQAAEKKVTVGTAKAAETITPGTADQTVPAGTYLSGALTIKGDANLIAENIADGVAIFGVPGTHKGGGSSGADFYKCAAVHGPYDAKTVVISGCPTAEINGVYLPTEFTTTDYEGNPYPVYKHETADYYYYYDANNWMNWVLGTDYAGNMLYMGSVGSSFSDPDWMTVEGMTGVYGSTVMDADVPKTWDGYKAVLSNGVYSFEDTLTAGLTYSSNRPQEFGVYNSDASIKTDWLIEDYPTDGLIFFAPLDRLDKAEIGGEMTKKAGQVEIENGMAKFINEDNYYVLLSGFLPFKLENSGAAFFCQFIATNLPDDNNGHGYPLSIRGLEASTMRIDGRALIFFGDANLRFSISEGVMHTVALVRYEDAKWDVYLDGELILSKHKVDRGFVNMNTYCYANIGHYFEGYIKNVLVYNRALSDAELETLYNKFRPAERRISVVLGSDWYEFDAIANGEENSASNYPVMFEQSTMLEGATTTMIRGVVKFDTSISKWVLYSEYDTSSILYRATTEGISGLTGTWEVVNGVDSAPSIIFEGDPLPDWNNLPEGVTYILVSPNNLTSNTSDAEWEPLSDTDFSDNYPKWKAFDGNVGGYLDGWLSAEVSGHHWIGIRHIGSPVRVTAYSFYPAWSGGNDAPMTWEFQGSNDGTQWVTLDSQSDVNVPKESVEYRYDLSEPANYAYYRLYITKNQGGHTYYAVGEFLLYSDGE